MLQREVTGRENRSSRRFTRSFGREVPSSSFLKADGALRRSGRQIVGGEGLAGLERLVDPSASKELPSSFLKEDGTLSRSGRRVAGEENRVGLKDRSFLWPPRSRLRPS